MYVGLYVFMHGEIYTFGFDGKPLGCSIYALVLTSLLSNA
jgi:hypothetical protein